MRKLYPVGSMEVQVFFLGMHKFLWPGLAIAFVLSLSLSLSLSLWGGSPVSVTLED